MINNEINQVLKEKIRTVLQKIQDNTISRPELATFDMREHGLYWELGILVKQFVDLNKIPNDHVNDFLSTEFRELEKEIRNEGKRKGKEPFPTWFMESKQAKKIKPPAQTWVQLSWEFADQYQDEERWKLVADLSGHRFKDNDGNSLFTRKFAEDLLPYFSKKEPIPNAEELQKIFIKEISKFDKKPSRESQWEPLVSQIFGKSKIDITKAKENFFSIKSEVEEAIDKNDGTPKQREEFVKSIQLNELNSLRTLLRLISLTDEKKFEKRLKDLGKLPPTIKTKHVEVKELYKILYLLIKDSNSRKKFLKRINSYELTLLNTKLKAVTNEDAYMEYLETQKLREELFS